MKKLFLLLSLTSICFGQNDTAAIKTAIITLFDGMRATDSSLSKTVLVENCTLKSVFKTKTGETKITTDPISVFLKSIGTPHPGIYDERLLSFDIKFDGSLAVAWTPYRLYVDDKFIHCGVDVFHLAKMPSGWKIFEIIDTRRKDCD